MRVSPRFSIAGLMAVVLVSSIGLAALRSGSAMWAGGLYLLAHGLFVLAVVGAVCRGASERAWWLGFALFGLVYLTRAFWYGPGTPMLPTTALLDAIRPEKVQAFGGPFGPEDDRYYWVVGNCLWSLVAATIGGLLASALFAAPAGSPVEGDAGPRPEVRPERARWRRFAAFGVAGIASLTTLVLLGRRSDPALWAGAAYLLTWVLLGIAALGFACGHGKRRMVWFGAALFGLGYMVLTQRPDRFEQPGEVHLVADQFLIAVRPWLPPIVSGFPAETAAVAAANARVRKTLEKTIPMTFVEETPLEDVLTYIRAATWSPDGYELPIYVDPVGLKEEEKTLQSPIQMYLEGQPLTTSLPLALHQLRLRYDVRNGLVHITSVSSEDTPVVVDYYLILGHCALALLAAGLGTALVPLVSDRKGPQAA